MPSQAANLGTLRTPHALRVFMSVVKGTMLLEATLNAVPAYPVTSMTITITTGTHTGVLGGMRVMVYNSNGDYKGMTRVRYNAAVTATTLPVRETSRGTIEMAAGDIVRVYNDVRLTDKLVAANASFAPDLWAYSDQGSNPPPVVADGGAWAGWTDMLPVKYTGDLSFVVDPDSANPVTHVWTLPAGLSFDSGISTSANVDVTGAAGEYHVKHVGTDPDNGKSLTRTLPVVIHDATNPPLEVILEGVEGTEEQGWGWTVEVLSSVTFDNVPDGAFVILWKEEFYDGTRQSFGSAAEGRSHIIGTGYLRRETSELSGEDGVERLRFEVISPLARLEELIGYSKVMDLDAAPNRWQEVKGLTTKRAILQIIQFYTNWIEAGFDIGFGASYVDYIYPKLYLDKQNPLAQVRDLADSTDARVVATRSGRMLVHLRPEYMAITARAAVTRTLVLTARDLLRWSYTREHWLPLEILECQGITAGATGNEAKFSRFPGLAPGLGTMGLVEEKLILTSVAGQTNINQRCGRRGAARQGIYVDHDGVMQMALDLELTLRGAYDVMDFYDEFVDFSGIITRRGIAFADQSFVPVSASLSVENGVATTTVRLRTVTNGAMGQTYVPPSEEDNGLPPYTSPDLDFPPIVLIPGPPPSGESLLIPPEGSEPVKLFALSSTSCHIYRATSWNPTTGLCSWENINDGTVTGQGVWASADPYNYSRRFVLTTTGLWRCNDIWAAVPTWVQVATNLQMFGNATWVGTHFRMSINKRGWIAVASSANMLAVTFTYGASWTQVAPLGGTPSGGTSPTSFGVLAVSTHNSDAEGHMYFGYYNSAVQDTFVYKSLDWGLTWNAGVRVYNGTFTLSYPTISIPHIKDDGSPNSNGAAQMVQVSHMLGGGSIWFISHNGGATWNQLVANPSGIHNYPLSYSPDGIHHYTQNARYILSANHGSAAIVIAANTPGATLYPNVSKFSTGFGINSFSNQLNTGIHGWGVNENIALYWNEGGVLYFLNGLFNGGPVTVVSLLSGITDNSIVYAEFDLSDYIEPAE